MLTFQIMKDEITPFFDSLEKSELRRASQKATRAAAKIVRDETFELAPMKSGALRMAIKVKAAKRRKYFIAYNIIISRDAMWKWYAPAVDLGHKTKSGTIVPSKDFMSEGLEEREAAVIQRIVDILNEELSNETF
jgi:hypothetical protein